MFFNLKAAVVAVVLLVCAHIAAAGQLKFEFDGGLRSATLGETELVASGQPVLRSVIFEKQGMAYGRMNYSDMFEPVTPAAPEVSWNAATQTLTQVWDWGSIAVEYAGKNDRLGLSITIENNSDRIIADFEIELIRLSFSEMPEELGENGSMTSSLDDLATVTAIWSDRKLVACVDTIYPPVRFGFAERDDGGYPLVIRGGVYAFEEGAVEMHPHGLPRIASGERKTFDVSLRVASSETPCYEVIVDLYEAFREFYQPTLEWDDRRPIGAVFLGGGRRDASARNPRGWGMRNFNMTCSLSMVEFRRGMLAQARSSAEVLKNMDAQGVIIWNVEGEEMPHPVSYIGDPRMTKIMVPEFNSVADDYFRVFLDAGLRTGVTLRPTQVYARDGGWHHGTGSHMDSRNPLDDDLDKFRPDGLPQWRFYPVVERMSRKIQYAQRRWGCTIFYIDTNGINVPVGPDNQYQWMLLDGLIWKQLHERHPDVLLIPELRRDNHAFRAAQWAYTAPYEQLDYTERSATPEHVRRLLPDSFVCNYIANTDRERLAEWTPRLISAVRGGDVFMFRGWFNCGVNVWVRAYYDAARLLPLDVEPTAEEMFEMLDEVRRDEP